MKKYLLTLTAGLAFGLNMNAQYVMKITKTDGTSVLVNADEVKDITFAEAQPAEDKEVFAGWSHVVFPYAPAGMLSLGDKAEFTEGDNQTTTLKFSSPTWGEATISGIAATQAGGTVTLAETEGVITMSNRGTAKDYPCVLTSGQLTHSATDGNSCDLVISVPSVMGGTTITFKSGTAPVEKVFEEAQQLGGWSSASSAYFKDNASDKDTVTIALSDAAAQALTVTYKSDTWGEATFSGVSAKATADGYQLMEAEGTVLMQGMGGGEPKPYAVVLKEGTISSDLKTYKILFSVPSVMGGVSIIFQNGSAPATEETKE